MVTCEVETIELMKTTWNLCIKFEPDANVEKIEQTLTEPQIKSIELIMGPYDGIMFGNFEFEIWILFVVYSKSKTPAVGGQR